MRTKTIGNTVVASKPGDDASIADSSGILDQDPLPGPLLDALPVGLLVLDQTGHVLFANRMAETLLGVRASETHDRLSIRAAFDVVCERCSPVPFRDVEVAQLARLGQGEKPLEMVLERPDGSQVSLNLRVTSLPQSRVAITLEDIGPRMLHAAALEAHTRLVEQAGDLGLEKLLCASLDELQALTGSAVGAYSFLDEDERCIRPQAWSTQVEAHGYGGKGSPPLVTLQGAWAEAVKQRRAVVHNEPPTSAKAWPFPHGSVPIGTELVVPVMRKGKVRAVVGVANKPSRYDEADTCMVERIANLSWELASLKLAKADAERRAEQIQKVAASTPGLVGMFRRDRDGRATLHHVSPVDDDFYGVPASGLATDLSGFVARIHPDDIERLRQALAVSSEKLAPYHQRWRFQHSTKGWRWHETWAVPHREPDGSTLWYGFLMDVTAQADVEAVAAENATRFEEAFEHAAIGIVLTRLDFKLAKVNQAFCDMLGFSKDELLDVEILSLTHPDDRSVSLEGRQLATHGEDGKATHRLEKRYRHKNGHWIWVQVDFSLVRDRNGNPSHFVSQVHDISKRKRAEQERSLTIEILGILNQTDDPIAAARLILTAIRTALEVDAAAIRLVDNGDFGYVVHEGFSQEFLEAERCLHTRAAHDEALPDEEMALACACGRVARGQVDATCSMFTPKGSACIDNSPAMPSVPSERAQRPAAHNPCFRFGYQSVLVVPVRSGDRILGVLQLNDRRPHAFSPEQISFLEGIAPTLGFALERKQVAAEREAMAHALRSSEERFAKAFQSAPMLGVISRIVDATIIDVNQEFCRATGYQREQLLGTTPFALGISQPEQRHKALQELQSDGHLRNHEFPLRRKNGSPIDCLLSSDVIDVQGEKFLLSMLMDVTESKRAQAAIRESDERFRLLIEHAPAALAMFDTDMRYLAVSRRWLEDYRLVGQNLLGKSHYAIFPEISESWKAIHQRALRGETVSSNEDRFDRKDGSVQWQRWEVVPWHRSDGSIGGIVIFSEDITARKVAESENTASRAKLAAALDSVTDAVFIADTQGHFIDFNDACAVFHRFRNKQECLRSFADYPSIRELSFPSGAPAPVEQWPVQRALRGESGTNVEYGIRRTDTGETWVGSYSYAPIRNSTDVISGAVVVARDITEQRRAEKALHDLSERLHQVSEAAKEWIWEGDANGLYTYSSSVVEQLLGYKPEELVGRYHYYDLWPDEERATRLSVARQTVGRKEAFSNLPNTCRHKDGHPVMLETTGFPVLDASGVLIGYRGANRDVTEREKAAAALRESEVRFRELFEHSPVAIWEEDLSAVAARFSELRAQGVLDLRAYLRQHPEDLVDLSKRVRILEVNDASLKLLGASSAEELSKELPKYFNEGALAAFGEKAAELYAGKTKVETETPHLDIHGNVLELQLRLSVLPGHASDLSRVLVSFTDLTARKAAEAERRKLECEVNHLQRLESLGRLASGVSHDMNNVLGAVMAIGSLLKARHKNDPVVSKDADALLDAAVRGRDLVRGLRDFSRKELESARKLDLNELVQHEASLLERTTLKRVSIGCDLAPDLPSVIGEASGIQNALMNLCVNALDAMPDHGTLTLSSRNLGQGFVEVAVEDDGHGMAPEVLARALEPFFTTKPIGKGTGLGLSQVYGTVKAHGGTLDIQSKPGVGTRVSMAFPSVQVLADLKNRTDLWSLGAVHPLSVLLVDDEEMIRGTVLSLLDVLGHHAQAASSGIEALRRLNAGMEVDLVMLDINMPGMDGVETLSRLRVVRPELKVLFATGHTDERIPSILDRFPSVHILKKPFNITELARALSDWP